jgi:molecular chaperone DnaK
MENLTKVSHKIAEIMYQQAQKEGASTTTTEESEDKDDKGDVIDAEFEDEK